MACICVDPLDEQLTLKEKMQIIRRQTRGEMEL